LLQNIGLHIYILTYNWLIGCTLVISSKCFAELATGADTGGDAGDASPTRPKEVLTWHLISLKALPKYFCTTHYSLKMLKF